MKRRTFIAKATTMALSTALTRNLADKPKLSFSTLGCPKWSWVEVITCASQHGYQGIELRGLQGQLDLPLSPAFANMASRKATLAQAQDKGLAIVGLGSSAKMHLAERVARQQQLDDAKRFIDLAHDLDCPNVRVFPDDLPKEQDTRKTLDLIAQGLLELGRFASGTGVNVLLESHGKVVSSDLVLDIMQAAKHPNVGLIWDVVNMWVATGEKPSQVCRALFPYIRHVHLKDLKLVNGKEQYVMLGQGEAPLSEAIKALRAAGYQGYFSYEWEKLWHPDLEEPEVALPAYPKAIQQYF
jgi:sugar phosphate isomerase/epimerase